MFCALHISGALQVERAVAAAALNDEVFFAVRPQLASPDKVVDLELIAPAATLAFPVVPQDFQLQLAEKLGVEPKPPPFSKIASHADRQMSRKNCSWCAAERNASGPLAIVDEASNVMTSSYPSACGSRPLLERK